MDAGAYADMLPWLVFLVIDRKSGLGVAWAGCGALACSAALVAWSYWRGRHALVPRAAMVLFALCLVAGLASQTVNQEVSVPRAVVLGVLSALAFGSLPFTPISQTYTVPLVAPALRDDPRFARVNIEITRAWGVGSLAVAVASGTTALLSGAVAFTFLDWVTPIVLAAATILWATRRWELFRLAVDTGPVGSVAVGYDAPDGPVRLHESDDDSPGFPTALATRRVLPVVRHGHPGGTAGAGAPEASTDAVIHRLPLRGRNI